MKDELRDLLQSPLDERPAPIRWRRGLPFAAAAAAAGALLVLGATLLWGDSGGDAAALTTAAATTTTGPSTTTSTVVVPAGFTAATDRFGLRPDLMIVRGDRVYVSVTAAIAAGADPATVVQMEAGLWYLGSGAGRTEYETEFAHLLVPGRITIQFPAAAADATVMEVIPGTRAQVEDETAVDAVTLPFAGPLEDNRVPLARGVELVVDGIAFDQQTGSVEWHLEGGTSERARVGVQIDLMEDGAVLGTIFSRFLLGTVAFLRESEPPPGPTRAGVTDLGLPFGTSIDPARVNGAVLRWTVELFHYEEEPLFVSLDGIERLEVG